MYMSSYSIYTEKAKLMHPEDPEKDYIIAAIFWITVIWVIVGWWFLY